MQFFELAISMNFDIWMNNDVFEASESEYEFLEKF